MSTDTETQRFGGVRSIDWKTALGAIIEITGALGIVVSATVIYALFIVAVAEVMPMEQLSRSALQLIRFSLAVPPAAGCAVAATRVANFIAGDGHDDLSPRTLTLLTVGVMVPMFALGVNLVAPWGVL